MRKHGATTKRASYRHGVEWIALNDNAGEDFVSPDCRDGNEQQKVIDTIAAYISTSLLADLFGANRFTVALDVFRVRQRELYKPTEAYIRPQDHT